MYLFISQLTSNFRLQLVDIHSVFWGKFFLNYIQSLWRIKDYLHDTINKKGRYWVIFFFLQDSFSLKFVEFIYF